MAIIDTVNKIPIINDEVSKRQQWQMRKRLRVEAQQHQQKNEDEILEASLFKGDEHVESGFERRIKNMDRFDNGSLEVEDEVHSGELLNDAEVFEEFASRYLSTTEIDELWKNYDLSEDKRSDIKKMIEQIIDSTEGAELSILNTNLERLSLNKAQMYLALNYVMEELRRRIAKKRFLSRLKKWIVAYENQESGYLAEFFALSNNKDLLSKISKKCNIDALAGLNSGDAIDGSIRQTIQLVAELFDNNFASMVSLFMKLRAKQLGLLQHEVVNPEYKAKLHEMLSLEKKLIIVHSIYLHHKDFKVNLEKITQNDVNNSNTCSEWLKTEQTKILNATVHFCETSFISDMAVERLVRDWGISGAIQLNNNSFLRDLIPFLHKLPLVLFKDNTANVQKVTEGVRNIMREKSEEVTNVKGNSTTVSFLKSKSKKINYV